jgi:probable F420-dependent oxidoreductase
MIPIGWFGVGSGALADAEGVAAAAQPAEALGFDSIWVGEHPVLIDPHKPPSPLPPRSEMMDPVPVLAYAAAATSRIQLGTGIVIMPLRNPVILAKQLATVDVLSRGRLLVGIGVGYVPGEYAAIGVPFATRGRRADEWIDALRTLWRDDEPRFEGEFGSFGGIQCRPQPYRPAARRSWPAGCRRGPPAGGGPLRRLVRVLQDLDHTGTPLAELRAPGRWSAGRPKAGWRSPSRPCRPDRCRHRAPLRGPRRRPAGAGPQFARGRPD